MLQENSGDSWTINLCSRHRAKLQHTQMNRRVFELEALSHKEWVVLVVAGGCVCPHLHLNTCVNLNQTGSFCSVNYMKGGRVAIGKKNSGPEARVISGDQPDPDTQLAM